MEVEIKPAQPLPEFGQLPKKIDIEAHLTEEDVKAMIKEAGKPTVTDEIAKPRYIWQTLAISVLILAIVLFWRYGLKPELDRMAVDCTAGEVKQ